jgi:hypothetical protein
MNLVVTGPFPRTVPKLHAGLVTSEPLCCIMFGYLVVYYDYERCDLNILSRLVPSLILQIKASITSMK